MAKTTRSSKGKARAISPRLASARRASARLASTRASSERTPTEGTCVDERGRPYHEQTTSGSFCSLIDNGTRTETVLSTMRTYLDDYNSLPKVICKKKTTTDIEVTETLYGDDAGAAAATVDRQQTEDPDAMDVCDPHDADLDPPASFADREAIASFTRYLNARIFIDDTMAGIRARIAARKDIDDAQEMADADAPSTSRQGAAAAASDTDPMVPTTDPRRACTGAAASVPAASATDVALPLHHAPPERVLARNAAFTASANMDGAGRGPSTTTTVQASTSRSANRPARRGAFEDIHGTAGTGAASTSRQAANIQAATAGPSEPPAYSFTTPSPSVDLPNIRIVNDVYYIDITDDEGDMAGDATDCDA